MYIHSSTTWLDKSYPRSTRHDHSPTGTKNWCKPAASFAIEKAEKDKSITLDSLERAARALDCRVVYTLVPRKSLSDIVEERARKVAKERLQSTQHSMALEAQSIDKTDEEEQLRLLSERLIKKAGSELWEDSA